MIKCSDDSFYIGQTDDLHRRFEDHEHGKVSWTAPRQPLVLIHWETFDTREEAVKREQDLKTGFGRQWLKTHYQQDGLAARQAGDKKKSLGRANAAKFVERLCQYPGKPAVIAEAQQHILAAHAERLTRELQPAGGTDSLSARRTGGEGRGEVGSASPAWIKEFNWPADKSTVTVEDILAGRAPRPRVLDMFAGGGAIPLEALRLGCEAYALDLNPVAHIIQLCTLVYPQKYGQSDPAARGMTGPKNPQGETTWGGLAAEVRYWGEWVLEKVRAEIGDLYPHIPDPEFSGQSKAAPGAGLPEFEAPRRRWALPPIPMSRLPRRLG